MSNRKQINSVTRKLKQLRTLTDSFLIKHVHKGVNFTRLAIIQQHASYFYQALDEDDVEILCSLSPCVVSLSAKQLFNVILAYTSNISDEDISNETTNYVFDCFANNFNKYYHHLDKTGSLNEVKNNGNYFHSL